jgi:hypothetical protein
MPNWNQIVRENLAVLRLPPEREIEIVEELALHMETVYEAARADGLSEAEARALRSYDWRLLECELSREEQPLAARAWQPPQELIERAIKSVRGILFGAGARLYGPIGNGMLRL